MDALEAMRLGVGPGVVLSYVLQGLFHPARRVREVYWRLFSKSILFFEVKDQLLILFQIHSFSDHLMLSFPFILNLDRQVIWLQVRIIQGII